MRGEQVAARDDPDDRARRVAPHDGEAADVLQHHLVRRVAQRVVLVDHDRRAPHELAHRERPDARHLARLARLVEQVAPRHDADQPVAVDHREPLVRRAARG